MNVLTFPNLLALAEAPELRTWEPFREGVSVSRLQGEPSTAPAAALLRYQPGASVPEHKHMGWEYIFVISGSQQDHHGRYTRGTLRINPPGSRHSVQSPEGCLVLAIWERSVAFVAPAASNRELV